MSTKEKLLTQARLKELLHYDPETGVFTRIAKRKGGSGLGKPAGYVRDDGYVEVCVDYNRFLAHRLVIFYVTGAWPEVFVDHANRDRQDNRFCNLRQATNAENMRNANIQKNNTSGVRGVSWSKAANKWVARIKAGGRYQHLGCFEDFEEAVSTRQAAMEKYHGEFAGEIRA